MYPGLVIDPAVLKEAQIRNINGAGKADPNAIRRICEDLKLQEQQADKVAKFAEVSGHFCMASSHIPFLQLSKPLFLVIVGLIPSSAEPLPSTHHPLRDDTRPD
jgi:hypothetical protein